MAALGPPSLWSQEAHGPDVYQQNLSAGGREEDMVAVSSDRGGGGRLDRSACIVYTPTTSTYHHHSPPFPSPTTTPHHLPLPPPLPTIPSPSFHHHSPPSPSLPHRCCTHYKSLCSREMHLCGFQAGNMRQGLCPDRPSACPFTSQALATLPTRTRSVTYSVRELVHIVNGETPVVAIHSLCYQD